MKIIKLLLTSMLSILNQSSGYWDRGTTTPAPYRTDTLQRLSFFRWQRVEMAYLEFWYSFVDWIDNSHRRRLCVVAGISIDLTPLSTAAILNRRVLLTAANYLDPLMTRMKDLRIWALGRKGEHCTPYRYRVWKVWRVLPKSNNPEHQHGPRGTHVPRHDLAVIISWDQMYIYYTYPRGFMYAYRTYLPDPHQELTETLVYTGSGYEYLTHIYENYKIFYGLSSKSLVVDCSKYLPKWWGKFICLRNNRGFPGIQNGGPLLSTDNNIFGIGCFEIRYNEDRIFVFTDLRYYTNLIRIYADITPDQYFEYAYPQWGTYVGGRSRMTYDRQSNSPEVQPLNVIRDLYPLG